MAETGDAGKRTLDPAAVALQDKFDQAMALHRQGNLADAERNYREILQRQPNHFGALHLLGVIARETRHPGRAVELIGRAIALKPDFAEAHSNRGLALLDLKRSEEALASFDGAIALKPDFAGAHYNRGNALHVLGRGDAALASFATAIALQPDFAEAYNNRGNVLLAFKRLTEALASFDKAVALKPGFAEAHNNRGNALKELKRPAEALSDYEKATALNPEFAEAYSNRGSALEDLKRPVDALASYDLAIALKPDFARAYSNRGNTLLNMNRPEEALASSDKAIALEPEFALAYRNRGAALERLNRFDEAIIAYDKALALGIDIDGAEGERLFLKLRICDWSNLDSECAHLISSVRNGRASIRPFAFFNIPSSSDDQLQCAKLWSALESAPSQKPVWRGEGYDHDRIRVAYLSPDFREHPLSYLIAGMFECHDKSRFDVTGISCGPDDHSETRRRLMASFDHFIDATTQSDDRIAALVKEMEIDIFVNLAGFTSSSRTGIFARRPAPTQVNYLGYPGTMGAAYIDYIIADQVLIPKDQRKHYAEKIVYLPDSYQANDSKRPISDRTVTRDELGLPPSGFVFCCFNNTYKITPHIFDSWMRILKQIEGSVLWLLEDNAKAAGNLRTEAMARNIGAERLVFAGRVSLPDHLARQRLADLFLDTLPCNAHTTASDALWAGLPVLTCLGETFAGRVAGSLLNAIHLPELITTSLEDYEQTAIDLAIHPEKLAIVKRKLNENRLTTPLFNTKLITKNIEAAYAAMLERHQAGLPPDHMAISN